MIEHHKNIVYGYVSKFSTIISGLVLSIVLVKWLDVREFGEYRLLASWMVILSTITSLGLEGVLQRYTREFLDRQDYNALHGFIVFLVCVRGLTLAIVSTIMFLMYDVFKSNFELSLTFLYFSFMILIFIFIQFKNLIGIAFLTAYMQVYLNSVNIIFTQLLKLSLFSYVAFYGYGLKGLILAWLFVELVSLLHFLVIFMHKLIVNMHKSGGNVNRFSDGRRILRFWKYQAVSAIMILFLDVSLDNVMIGYYLNRNEVALYAFALGLISLLSNLNPLVTFRGLLSSLITRYYVTTKSLDVLRTNFVIISKLTMAIMIPSYIIFTLNAERIIQYVYSTEYLRAVYVIYLGAPFLLLRELMSTFTPFIYALERNNLVVYASIISSLGIVGHIFFIPSMGVLGAILSRSISIIVVFLFYVYQLRKIFGKAYYPWDAFVRINLYHIPVVAFHFIINQYIVNIALLAVAILLEFMMVFLIYVKFKIFTQEERCLLNRLLNRDWINF